MGGFRLQVSWSGPRFVLASGLLISRSGPRLRMRWQLVDFRAPPHHCWGACTCRFRAQRVTTPPDGLLRNDGEAQPPAHLAATRCGFEFTEYLCPGLWDSPRRDGLRLVSPFGEQALGSR